MSQIFQNYRQELMSDSNSSVSVDVLKSPPSQIKIVSLENEVVY